MDMRFKRDDRPSIYDEYRKWFAWYPVVVDNEIAWLETVERMRWINRFSFEGEWVYRALKGNKTT